MRQPLRLHSNSRIGTLIAVSICLTSTLAPARAEDKPTEPDSETSQRHYDQPDRRPGKDGHIGLSENKRTLTLVLTASQSRAFKTPSQITRTSIADPIIADPVVVDENTIVFAGKAPGETTADIWTVSDGMVGIKIIVEPAGQSAKTSEQTKEKPFQQLEDATILKLSESVDPRDNLNASSELKQKFAAASAKIAVGEEELSNSKASPLQGRATKLQRRQQHDSLLFLPAPEPTTVILQDGFAIKKPSATIDLLWDHSRLFRTTNRIARANVENPDIAEPVVVLGNEFTILGKAPGVTRLEIQDITGTKEAFDVSVHKPAGKALTAWRRITDVILRALSIESPNLNAPAFEQAVTPALSERTTTETVHTQKDQQKFLTAADTIQRVSIADDSIAHVGVVLSNEVVICAKKAGRTNLFIWTRAGESARVEIIVDEPSQKACPPQPHSEAISEAELKDADAVIKSALRVDNTHEIEVWRPEKKQVFATLSVYPKALENESIVERSAAVIKLNNAGVKALNAEDFQTATELFKRALILDPRYQLARENLGVAECNYALRLTKKPEISLDHFHRAFLLTPRNESNSANMRGIIRMMSLDPENFDTRVSLGDEAMEAHDWVGAVVEYDQALNLHRQEDVRRRWETAIHNLKEEKDDCRFIDMNFIAKEQELFSGSDSVPKK